MISSSIIPKSLFTIATLSSSIFSTTTIPKTFYSTATTPFINSTEHTWSNWLWADGSQMLWADGTHMGI